LFCFFISLHLASYGQVDSLLKEAEILFTIDEKEKGFNHYELAFEKMSEDDLRYGTILAKLFKYNIERDNERKLLYYFDKIISSKLDDREPSFDNIKEPFKNYRYKASKAMGEFYFNKKQYFKSLDYIDLADFSCSYHNNLLSYYKAEKIDLAFMRMKNYLEQDKRDSALYFLVKRAFEYDYKDQYPQFSNNNVCVEERELTDKIFSFFPINEDFKAFKNSLDKSIESIESKNDSTSTLIKMELNNMTYIIPVNSLKNSAEDCITYLKNAPFYLALDHKFPKKITPKVEEKKPEEEK